MFNDVLKSPPPLLSLCLLIDHVCTSCALPQPEDFLDKQASAIIYLEERPTADGVGG